MSSIGLGASNLQSMKRSESAVLQSAETLANAMPRPPKASPLDIPGPLDNVNPVEKSHDEMMRTESLDVTRSMVDLIAASRSYEANVSAVKALHDMARDASRLSEES